MGSVPLMCVLIFSPALLSHLSTQAHQLIVISRERERFEPLWPTLGRELFTLHHRQTLYVGAASLDDRRNFDIWNCSDLASVTFI